ncbi:MAG: efflux RND transporter periplasmic adaptor subunit [Phycisphaeraceae bacterium]|nr:efflux RND transporter periplasmic adaptor subunit [Phycisphaeraceae bacterium]
MSQPRPTTGPLAGPSIAHPAPSRGRRLGPTRRGGIAVPLAIVLASGAVVAGAAYFVMRDTGSSQTSSAELFQASVSSFDITVAANGELEAARQTEIRSELEKPADIVFVMAEGSRVRQGDLVVELASETIKNDLDEELLRVEQARNDLIGAENNLEIQRNENDSAYRAAILKLELAQIEWNKWSEGDDVKRLQELRLNIETSEKDHDRALEKFMRSQRLFDSEFLSRDELKQDEITELRARAQIQKAKLELNVYEEYERPKQIKQLQSNITEAEQDLERVKRRNAANLASREADVANRRRSLRIREERLAKLEDQLRKTKIFAPQDGLVVYATSVGERRGMAMFGGESSLQVGRTVRPNEALIILPDTSGMVASVRVHESLAGRVRRGQPASIRVDAVQGRTFDGTVSSIGILAESGGWRDPNLREYTVKITLNITEEEAKVLKPAMRSEAQIVLGRVNEALSIPVQAVFNDGATRYVVVPEGNRFRKVPVLVGQRSNTFAQVLAGIDEGSRVLVREPRPSELVSNEIPDTAIAALQEKAKSLGIPTGAPGGGRGGMPGMMMQAGGQAPGAVPGARPAGAGARPAATATDAATDASARKPDERQSNSGEKPAETRPAETRVEAPTDKK